MEHQSYNLSKKGMYRDVPMPYMPPSDPRFANPLFSRPPKEPKTALHEALEVLRLGKWYILSVFTLVFSGVAVYTFTAEPVFEATALMLVDTKATEDQDNLTPDFVKGMNINNAKLENQRLILQESMEIAERTSQRILDMRTLPSSGEPFRVLEMATSITQLAQLLQEDFLRIKPATNDGTSDALMITASSSTAEEAAMIAQLYAEEYVRETEEMSRERLTAQRLFLEQQHAEKKAELDDLERRLASYMNREGAVALDDQAKYTVAQMGTLQAMLEEGKIELSMSESHLLTLEQELMEIQQRLPQRMSSGVEVQMEQVQAQVADLELRVEQILLRNPDLRSNPNQDPTLRDLNQQVKQLRTRLRSLSEQYADELIGTSGIDPRKEGLNMNYLATLKRQIADERVKISGEQAKVRGLEARLREYDQKLRTIPSQHFELAKLEREKGATEELFTILDQKLQEVTIAEEAERGFARIIRPAIAPERPEKPKKAMNLAMGFLLGLMLGVGAAVARKKFDTRVYTPDDLNEKDINMLGVVPDMRQLIKKEFGKRSKIDFEGRDVSTALVALIAPISPIAEAYRRLYIKLQFSRDEMGIQNLMVTSPKAGAGKSTTALNLAFTTAQAGRRTLVIDADLRRPSLHDKLGLPEGPSLLELLSEDESRWDSERFYTGIENVYVITGIPVSQPAELLGSKRMMDLVERFRTEFDIIIFDTPPVLGAVDPVLLSRQCDGVIVVASSDGTDMDSLKQTIDELNSVGANVLGTVLNRFDPTSIYGYKNTYGYSYGSNSYVAS